MTRVGRQARVRVRGPVKLDEVYQPEPDIALVRPRPYGAGHPEVADTLLIVEVADPAADDREVKLLLYALAGVPEVWIVDPDRRSVDVHCGPRASGLGHDRAHGPGATLDPVAIDGTTFTVAELLGGTRVRRQPAALDLGRRNDGADGAGLPSHQSGRPTRRADSERSDPVSGRRHRTAGRTGRSRSSPSRSTRPALRQASLRAQARSSGPWRAAGGSMAAHLGGGQGGGQFVGGERPRPGGRPRCRSRSAPSRRRRPPHPGSGPGSPPRRGGRRLRAGRAARRRWHTAARSRSRRYAARAAGRRTPARGDGRRGSRRGPGGAAAGPSAPVRRAVRRQSSGEPASSSMLGVRRDRATIRSATWKSPQPFSGVLRHT